MKKKIVDDKLDFSNDALRNAINEELTINNEHVMQSEKLFHTINELYDDDKKWVAFRNGETFILKQDETILFNGKKIFVKIVLFDYPTKKDYKRWVDVDDLHTGFSDRNGELYIQQKSIGRNVDMIKLYNTIFHEMSHVMDYAYNPVMQYSNVPELYEIATENYFSENEVKNAIASIIYLTDKREIQAFGNGLYGELHGLISKYGFIAFEKSDAYKKVKRLCNAIDVIESNKKGVIESIHSTFNGLITYNKLILRGKIGYKAFLTKCGKVIVKFTKELNKGLRKNLSKNELNY